jgi:hypothetical protein
VIVQGLTIWNGALRDTNSTIVVCRPIEIVAVGMERRSKGVIAQAVGGMDDDFVTVC